MKRKYKQLYYLEGINEDTEQNIDFEKFVFCGINWGFYFESKVHKDCEKIENVELKKGNYNKKDPQYIDYDEELDLNLIYSKKWLKN